MQNADQTRTQFDVFDPDRARALEATLGMDPKIQSGDILPPFFHQVYFWESLPAFDLGPDGHPEKGSFLPDLGLPRRMWAAGKLTFHRPLVAGSKAERHSRIEGITRKSGKSGPLGFVSIRHDIKQRHSLAVTEQQDIVYRELTSKEPEVPTAPTNETSAQDIAFDTTMLFRYSALTFNGHRIHYDQTYAKEVEGYEGLVVHGPLLAQFLMLFAQHHLGGLNEFQYRATAPLLHHETATLCWKDGTAWVRGPDGRQCMIATAR